MQYIYCLLKNFWKLYKLEDICVAGLVLEWVRVEVEFSLAIALLEADVSVTLQ